MNADDRERFRRLIEAKQARSRHLVEQIVPNETERPGHWHRRQGRKPPTTRKAER